MENETNSLEDFRTFIWVPEKLAEEKGIEVIKSRWVLGERDEGERVKARVFAQQLNKGSPLDTYAAAPTSVAARILCVYAQQKNFQ
eukprot:7719741-Heterocapsa_arctica.AAC.1